MKDGLYRVGISIYAKDDCCELISETVEYSDINNAQPIVKLANYVSNLPQLIDDANKSLNTLGTQEVVKVYFNLYFFFFLIFKKKKLNCNFFAICHSQFAM